MNAPIKRSRLTGRTVCKTVLVLSILVILSYLGLWRGDNESSPHLAGRSLGPQQLECRMVHQYPDKCAFVQANCAEEDAGLISYLQFYYCSLRHVQPIAFAILVIWMGLLFSTIGIAASDFLCINLSTIASTLGMSESLTGVTFLAFGNGSPDVFSTFAAMRSGSGSLAVGELIGAASFITAVVAGSMAIVRPFEVDRKSFFRDLGFFVVAACFSMLFLADGRLEIWECACMVTFYLFYVIFVVTWHWWFVRRRQRRLKEVAARLHLHTQQTPEIHLTEEESEADEVFQASETTGLLQATAQHESSNLESNVRPAWKAQDLDEDQEGRDRQLANLRSNMRVIRPAKGERRNTIYPLRPSLVGALEFRSVLHSLEKRSNRAGPINLRRYSDEPSPRMPQDYINGRGSVSQHHSPRIELHAHHDVSRRTRAVSADDAVGLRLKSSSIPAKDTTSGVEHALGTQFSEEQDPGQTSTAAKLVPVFGSPQLLVSPPDFSRASIDNTPAPRAKSPDRLAPPNPFWPGFRDDGQNEDTHPTTRLSPSASPSLSVPAHGPKAPSVFLPSPCSEFPPYIDSPTSTALENSRPPSIRLPPPSLSLDSSRDLSFVAEEYEGDEEENQPRIFKWWPYRYLPPPQVLGRTLLPTVYAWRGKSAWDRFLGIVAVPSVFLLTITLPVVESEEKPDTPPNVSALLTPRDNLESRAGTRAQLSSDSPDLATQRIVSDMPAHSHKPVLSNANPVTIPTISEDQVMEEPQEWKRWLFCLQLFTAPLFTVAIGWANMDINHNLPSFIWYMLCSVLSSLICLLALLATTTLDRPPRYRPLFCFLGFAVAIAWISTIANEVVGVLKAFGVILKISDAILGLTIFAVGNSLGDLVADITVAKLGFPVMALSACFGGPMLNILLGIGVSGLYITIRHSAKSHHHHPDRPIAYKPYYIHVSTTLLISGITLLVTLVGLLIVVPLNGWKMDRKIGLGLIGLWSLSTIGNVAVEVSGWGSHVGVS